VAFGRIAVEAVFGVPLYTDVNLSTVRISYPHGRGTSYLTIRTVGTDSPCENGTPIALDSLPRQIDHGATNICIPKIRHVAWPVTRFGMVENERPIRKCDISITVASLRNLQPCSASDQYHANEYKY
jgi:hypothetical protein